jgi:RNA-binding protein
MESKPLNSAEKKELRGIAQRLKPHVHLGKQGLTDAVLNEIEMALTKNGLIKIRFEAKREAIKEIATQVASKSQSEYIGGVGRIGIFFRDMPEKNK